MTQQEGAHLLGVAVGPPTVDWGGGVRGVGEVALALEDESITDLPLGWRVRSQDLNWTQLRILVRQGRIAIQGCRTMSLILDENFCTLRKDQLQCSH